MIKTFNLFELCTRTHLEEYTQKIDVAQSFHYRIYSLPSAHLQDKLQRSELLLTVVPDLGRVNCTFKIGISTNNHSVKSI